jgi:ferredoxin
MAGKQVARAGEPCLPTCSIAAYTEPDTPARWRACVGPSSYPDTVADAAAVWIDQEQCTGDGLCVQYAPEVFEFDIDGLAYVKGADGELRQAPGARVAIPDSLRLDVLDSARECPGTCIHLVDAAGKSVLA